MSHTLEADGTNKLLFWFEKNYAIYPWGYDQDPDGDGLTNWTEFLANTNPLDKDVNGDGRSDADMDNDKDGLNHLFCLDTKKDTTMGSGFGITEKTDVFSISTVTCYTYINDIDSFRNGVWMERRTVESSYVYDLGYINSAGEVDWLVKDSIQYYVPQDQSRIIWLSPMSRLSTTAVPSGKTVEIAQNAVSFDALADGSRVYYRTAADSLFTVKGSGSAKKVASSIADFAVIDGVCSYITSDGAVHYAEGTNVTDVSSVTAAVRFDKRAGMLILYANQQEGAGEDAVYVYDAYCSANGREYTLAYSDVEP